MASLVFEGRDGDWARKMRLGLHRQVPRVIGPCCFPPSRPLDRFCHLSGAAGEVTSSSGSRAFFPSWDVLRTNYLFGVDGPRAPRQKYQSTYIAIPVACPEPEEPIADRR